MTTKNLMKKVMPLVLAFLMVLTTVLVPVNAKAEEAVGPITASSYILQVGEQWYVPVLNTTEDAKITYKIAKKKIATVDEDGLITAHKKGKCKIVITVKQDGKTYKAKAPITVKPTMTVYEDLCRDYTEFNYWFEYCFALAYANGWVLEDGTYAKEDGTYADKILGEWLNRYYRYVEIYKNIMANPDQYTDDEILGVQEAAQGTFDAISDMLEDFIFYTPDDFK